MEEYLLQSLFKLLMIIKICKLSIGIMDKLLIMNNSVPYINKLLHNNLIYKINNHISIEKLIITENILLKIHSHWHPNFLLKKPQLLWYKILNLSYILLKLVFGNYRRRFITDISHKIKFHTTMIRLLSKLNMKCLHLDLSFSILTALKSMCNQKVSSS